jgi:hypothetical protein
MVTGSDMNASEVLANRDLLNRLGYGIFDLAWGTSGYGFENVRNFSYVIAPDYDPKIYRHKVFDATGHYYNNQLAREVWYKLLEHKIKLCQEAGHEIELKTVAQDWLAKYSHAFFKDWTFHQAEIPTRIRYWEEPREKWSGVIFGHLVPQLKLLLDAGFTLGEISKATLTALKLKTGGLFYMRLVTSLLGYTLSSPEETEKTWQEIQQHQQYLDKQQGHAVDLHYAILDYYRRLNFMLAIEHGEDF